MSRKFLEKGNSITLPSDSQGVNDADASEPLAGEASARTQPSATSGAQHRSPRTAVGGMAAFMQAESLANRRLEELQREHAPFVGAEPARKLDPATIRRSRWANRHPTAFLTQEYADLRDDIRSAGGNVQPIKVRRLGPNDLTPSEAAATPPIEYEVVFGHRRHNACLELGLQVSAVVSNLSDQQLFVEMDRENRARADLSPYEQGAMYLNALETGLFSSMRQLAVAIGADPGNMSRALSVAQLPQAVIDAFVSPLEIRTRWAKPLSDAQQKDPEGLVARARALKVKASAMKASEVYEALVGEGAGAAGASISDPKERVVSGPHGAVSVSLDKKGRLVLKFDRKISPSLQADLERALAKILS